MIKFFRKIRQRLLTENKFSKYFLYAIGEIVLVVIGILLALNINNRNQQQINDAKITSILKEIQQDIVSDVERSKLIFDRFIRDDSIKNLILDNKLTADDYTFENRPGNNMGFNYSQFDFVINTSGYDNLMRNIDNISEKNQPILKDLKDIYLKIKSNIDIQNAQLRGTVSKNIDNNYSQSDWKLQERNGIVPDEKIKYYLHDPHYKNMVNRYMLDRSNIVRFGQIYRFKAIETYSKIQALIESTNPIPAVLGLEPKNEIFIESIVGTYKIKDTTLARWHKELKISHDGKDLHFIVKSRNVDFKLGHHKESIFVLRSTSAFLKFDTQNKGEILVKHPNLGYTTFIKEE